MLKCAEPGATFLLNSPFGPDEVWDKLPRTVQQQIIDKKLKFYVIDGYEVAKDTGMGGRINTIMQTCFFAISGVLPREEAIEAIKYAIKKTYGKRGESVVQKNFAAVDAALEASARGRRCPRQRSQHLRRAASGLRPRRRTSCRTCSPRSSPATATIFRSARCRSTAPSRPAPRSGKSATSHSKFPMWDEELCIQCGKCVLVCPHAVIRAKVYEIAIPGGRAGRHSSPSAARWKDLKDQKYTLQVAPEDCTGCALCVEVCPAKSQDRSRSTRPSTWSPRFRCASAKRATGTSSSTSPKSTAPRSAWAR